MYEKCTSDGKFKDNLRCRFDTKNQCSNYEGQALLSHYHEAAYDAHMTGIAFMQIIKFKEVEMAKINARNASKKQGQKKAPSS